MGWNKYSEIRRQNRKGEVLVCPVDGVEFYCPPSQVERRHFHTKECKAVIERGKRRTVKKVCKNCGKENDIRYGEALRGRGDFCPGTKCCYDYRRKKNEEARELKRRGCKTGKRKSGREAD